LSGATTSPITGWHDEHAKYSDTPAYRRDDAVLCRPSVQLTSLSAVVDEKSWNEKSATADWRIGGLLDEPL